MHLFDYLNIFTRSRDLNGLCLMVLLNLVQVQDIRNLNRDLIVNSNAFWVGFPAKANFRAKMCKYACDFRKLLRGIPRKCAKMYFEEAAQLVRNSEHTLKEIPRNVCAEFQSNSAQCLRERKRKKNFTQCVSYFAILQNFHGIFPA